MSRDREHLAIPPQEYVRTQGDGVSDQGAVISPAHRR